MENYGHHDFTRDTHIGLYVMIEIKGQVFVFNPVQVFTLEHKILNKEESTMEFKFKPKYKLQDFLALFHTEHYPTRIYLLVNRTYPSAHGIWERDYFRKGKFDAVAADKISQKKFTNTKYLNFPPEKKIAELQSMIELIPPCDVNCYAENFLTLVRQMDPKPVIFQLQSNRITTRQYIHGEDVVDQPQMPVEIAFNYLGESLFNGK